MALNIHVLLRIQNPVVSPREFSVPRQSSAVSPEMLGDVAGLQGSLESLRDLLGKLLCGGQCQSVNTCSRLSTCFWLGPRSLHT